MASDYPFNVQEVPPTILAPLDICKPPGVGFLAAGVLPPSFNLAVCLPGKSRPQVFAVVEKLLRNLDSMVSLPYVPP